MSDFIKMGTRLGSSYPLKKVQLKQREGFRFSDAPGEPLNRDLKGGVLVNRLSYDGDDWAPADQLDSAATYNDLSRHYGIWKDRGAFGLLPGNGQIEANEVTPLFNIFNSQKNLGWVGFSDTIGCDLSGFVDEAFLTPGNSSLSVVTPVSSKHYINHSSADADICLDAYILRDKQHDRS